MWSWLMPDCYCLTRCVTLCTVQELTTGLPPSDINLKISQRLSKELCLSIVWQSWHQPGPLEKRNLRGSLRILWHCINSVKLFCTVWLPGSLGSSTSGRLRRPCTRNSVLICRERYMRLAVGLESWLTGSWFELDITALTTVRANFRSKITRLLWCGIWPRESTFKPYKSEETANVWWTA